MGVSFASNALPLNLATGYFGTGQFKAMFLTPSYTKSEEHLFRNQVSSFEVAVGGGYVTGGFGVSMSVGSIDPVNNKVSVICSAFTVLNATFTFRYIWLYKSIGSASTDQLVGLVDYETPQVSNGADIAVGTLAIPITNTGVAAG
jgi:hypothetical protein